MHTQITETVVALTPRERDVLRLLAHGCTYRKIAAHLGVSPHTVVTHIKNAYRKLRARNAASAVMRAMQLGVLPSSPEPDLCSRIRGSALAN